MVLTEVYRTRAPYAHPPTHPPPIHPRAGTPTRMDHYLLMSRDEASLGLPPLPMPYFPTLSHLDR